MKVTIEAYWDGRCQISTDFGLTHDWGDQAILIVRRTDLPSACDGPKWAAIDFTQPGVTGLGDTKKAAFENLLNILEEVG